MPVAKHRPNFAELISHAAMQRQRLIDRHKNMFHSMTTERQRKLSLKPADVHPEVVTHFDENSTVFVSFATLVSTAIHAFVVSLPLRLSRVAAICMAFVVLSMHTSGELGDSTTKSLNIADKTVDIFFIVFGVLSMLSMYSNIKVKQMLGGNIEIWDIVRSSCAIDVITSVIAWSLGQSKVAVWFRMLRLLIISTFALQNLPHIDVLVSGISLGVRSLVSTWLLLTLTFVVYSACGLTFFGKNDPAHFGTMAMSMWTFFQLATLDNWSIIMYINMYGCDRYPTDYVVVGNSTDLPDYVDRYGNMMLSVCKHPMARPIVSSVIFVSFIFICGFILISLTIAAVTSGINDRLSQLEKEEMVREKSIAGDANSLLKNRDMLLMLMLEVWKQDEEYKKETRRSRKRTTITRSSTFMENLCDCVIDCNLFDMKKNGVFMRTMTNHYVYRYSIAFFLTFAAFLEIWVIQNPGESASKISWAQLVLQFLFSFDICLKLIASYPVYMKFFDDDWNTFDFFLVLGTWVPIFTVGQPGHEYFRLLRVFRILRLLRLLSWIADLNIMLRAIAASAKAMVYVVLLMFLFFYNFAIVGVLLFQQNDYYGFGDLFKAVMTLVQISTLDDWSEVAKTNMYGCDYYGYDSGEDYYDHKCDNPKGLGWIAAWYFLIFIVFGVMVLVSLFVGIIITSMELLKEGIKEEEEVWEKVREMQKEFNLRDTTVDNLLEIFDLIDIGENGKLTLPELKPILELVSVTQTDQFSLFMMVDKDSSGQIDFAEFIQLIHIMGMAYNRNIRKLRKDSVVEIPNSNPSHVLAHGFGSAGNIFASYMATGEQPPEEEENSDADDRSVDGEKRVPRVMSVADAQALSLLEGDEEHMLRKRSAASSADARDAVQSLLGREDLKDRNSEHEDEEDVESVHTDVSAHVLSQNKTVSHDLVAGESSQTNEVASVKNYKDEEGQLEMGEPGEEKGPECVSADGGGRLLISDSCGEGGDQRRSSSSIRLLPLNRLEEECIKDKNKPKPYQPDVVLSLISSSTVPGAISGQKRIGSGHDRQNLSKTQYFDES